MTKYAPRAVLVRVCVCACMLVSKNAHIKLLHVSKYAHMKLLHVSKYAYMKLLHVSKYAHMTLPTRLHIHGCTHTNVNLYTLYMYM